MERLKIIYVDCTILYPILWYDRQITTNGFTWEYEGEVMPNVIS